MGAYDPGEIAETMPMVHEADQIKPDWIVFQTDDGPRLKRMVHWLLTHRDSPLGWTTDEGKPTRKAIIQWRTAQGWTDDVHAPPIRGELGRIGRIRFRKPRS